MMCLNRRLPAARRAAACTLTLAAAIMTARSPVTAELITAAPGAAAVAAALAQLSSSVDSCGQPLQISLLLAELQQCPGRRFQINADAAAERNVFDRDSRTISWNPELRSELEDGCNGDANEPVYRDPTASLLHEIVHAVQECRGLNPGEHEIEAVAIENLYRRASGLCQRSRYGDESLPAQAWNACTPVGGACAPPPMLSVSWTPTQALTARDPHRSGDQP